VTAGQRIATVGATGLARGAHLHYEILVHGAQVDPLRTPLGSLLSGPAAPAPAPVPIVEGEGVVR